MKINKLGFLLLIVCILYFSGCTTQSKHFTIGAECGVLMGEVVNRINNEEDCRVQCRNQCFSEDLDLARYEFIQDKESQCNSCECYCR